MGFAKILGCVHEAKIRCVCVCVCRLTPLLLSPVRMRLRPFSSRSARRSAADVSLPLTLYLLSTNGCRLGRFQIQTRVSVIDSLSPPFVIGLDVLRHCR